MLHHNKIFIAGHTGLVGSSIFRSLKLKGFNNLIIRSHKQLDLVNQQSVLDFFASSKPDIVILAAAKVGGIYANDNFPADFIYENIMIQTNVIHASFQNKVKKLLFLGSSCIYPKSTKQPIKESSLMTGYLEPTNEPYAVAKISGIKLCESFNRQFNTDFRSIMPTNLYGINDNFHPKNSHVIPALIGRFHNAKIENLPKVEIWGDGSAKREFLFVDDLADASIYLLQMDKSQYESQTTPSQSHINIGTGNDISIKKLAEMIKKVVGYQGEIFFDTSKPNGTAKKLLNNNKLNNLGWKFKVDLLKGLNETYEWYKSEIK
jgi:GDP-L-fucose synthase